MIGQTAVEDELMMRLAHFRQKWPELPPEPSARANALTDRIAIDWSLSETLFEIRQAIAEKARIRAGAGAAFGANHPDAVRRGIARDAADRALFEDHCRRLIDRTRDNRRLLEQLVLIAPEVEVIPAERQLMGLEQRLPKLCGGEGSATAKGQGRVDGQPVKLEPPDAPLVRKF